VIATLDLPQGAGPIAARKDALYLSLGAATGRLPERLRDRKYTRPDTLTPGAGALAALRASDDVFLFTRFDRFKLVFVDAFRPRMRRRIWRLMASRLNGCPRQTRTALGPRSLWYAERTGQTPVARPLPPLNTALAPPMASLSRTDKVSSREHIHSPDVGNSRCHCCTSVIKADAVPKFTLLFRKRLAPEYMRALSVVCARTRAPGQDNAAVLTIVRAQGQVTMPQTPALSASIFYPFLGRESAFRILTCLDCQCVMEGAPRSVRDRS